MRDTLSVPCREKLQHLDQDEATRIHDGPCQHLDKNERRREAQSVSRRKHTSSRHALERLLLELLVRRHVLLAAELSHRDVRVQRLHHHGNLLLRRPPGLRP